MSARRLGMAVLSHGRSLEAMLLASQGAGVLTSIVVARSIGPSGRGIITALTTWGQVLGWVAAFSLDKALIVRTSGAHALTGADDGLRVARAAVTALSIPTIAITVVVGRSLFSDAWLSLALVVIAVATAQTELVSGWLLARRWRERFTAWRFVQPVFYLLTTVAVALAFRNAGLYTRTLAIGAGAAASVAIPVLIACIFLPRRPFAKTDHIGAFLRFGVAAQTGNLLQYLNGRLDILALSFLVTPRSVGYYVVGAGVAQATLLLGTAGVVRAMTGETARWDGVGIAIACALAAVVAVISPFAIPWIFGADFRPSVPIAQILALGGPVNYGLQVACGRLLAANRPWEVAVAQGAGVVFFGSIIVAAPTVRGAAWASVLSYAVSFVIAEQRVRRLHTSPTTGGVDPPPVTGPAPLGPP